VIITLAVSDYIGSCGAAAATVDGTFANARFVSPSGMSWQRNDAAPNTQLGYILELNGRLVRVDEANNLVTTIYTMPSTTWGMSPFAHPYYRDIVFVPVYQSCQFSMVYQSSATTFDRVGALGQCSASEGKLFDAGVSRFAQPISATYNHFTGAMYVANRWGGTGQRSVAEVDGLWDKTRTVTIPVGPTPAPTPHSVGGLTEFGPRFHVSHWAGSAFATNRGAFDHTIKRATHTTVGTNSHITTNGPCVSMCFEGTSFCCFPGPCTCIFEGDMRDITFDERDMPYGTGKTMHKMAGNGLYAIKGTQVTVRKNSGDFHHPMVLNAFRLLYHPAIERLFVVNVAGAAGAGCGGSTIALATLAWTWGYAIEATRCVGNPHPSAIAPTAAAIAPSDTVYVGGVPTETYLYVAWSTMVTKIKYDVTSDVWNAGFAIIAGDPNTAGYVDGAFMTNRFNQITAMAGNMHDLYLYVYDAAPSYRLRLIDQSNNNRVLTIGGDGTDGSSATSAFLPRRDGKTFPLAVVQWMFAEPMGSGRYAMVTKSNAFNTAPDFVRWEYGTMTDSKTVTPSINVGPTPAPTPQAVGTPIVEFGPRFTATCWKSSNYVSNRGTYDIKTGWARHMTTGTDQHHNTKKCSGGMCLTDLSVASCPLP